MVDNFALLNQPRRPWLDPEEVQARFVSLSSESHPDRVHDAADAKQEEAHQRFTDLNAACQCLRDPRLRLRHLLELERGTKTLAIEQLPSSATDFYFALGQLCRQVDQLLGEKATAASPLLKVQFFQRAMVWRPKLEQVQQELARKLVDVDRGLKELSEVWDAAGSPETKDRAEKLPLDRLEQLYREVSYLLRWSDQVRDRLVQLSV